MKRRVAVLAVSLATAITALSGCGASKYTEPFKDAPRGETNSDPADLITFPDGFSNAATKCDHGNRVYVLYHNNAAYGSVTVVPNAKDCQ